ncbi:MAG: LysE family transporter [Methanomassiliicoccus sp.]|nr:LysE family transporter [Methanomassiliicoccus sp.]
MDGLGDPLLFLGLVAFISLSGALMPGPVFATAVAKGYQDRHSGAKIAAGHAIIEVPLVVAIFLGFETVLKDPAVFALIGLVGGAFLLYMGVSMMRTRIEDGQVQGSKLGPFTAGIALTAVNPYFLLWWATVGASLIGTALGYGLIILPLFVIVHLACDLGWLEFVSLSVNRSKRFLTGRRYRLLFMACGTFLIVFALYFVVSSFQAIL